MKEADLMRALARAASEQGARLFRQQTGTAWASNRIERTSITRKVTLHPGDIVLRQARPFHAGFEGLSDLGGFVPVIVTAEMIGQTLAVYTQVEVKAGTVASTAQAKWIDTVQRFGGRAGVARSVEDLRKILFNL